MITVQVACLERTGVDLAAVIGEHEILHKNRHNIEVLTAAATNDISSTVIRKQLRAGKSVKYMVTDGVAKYIAENDLKNTPQWQQGNE